MTKQSIQQETIQFANHRKALALYPMAEHTAKDIADALGLGGYKAVIFLSGGAGNLDPALEPALTQLLGRGVARGAAEAGAVILDGGTQSGVMQLMGAAVAANEYRTPLIGVAPRAKAGAPPLTPLDPNHSYFVLTEGEEWGDETSMLLQLTGSLGQSILQHPGPRDRAPILVLLAGGGKIAKNEILMAVRQRLPIIVIEKSGGLADTIAAAAKAIDQPVQDPVLAEILEDGKLLFHELGDPVKGMIRLISRELGEDKVLLQAWETFADYDMNAGLQQRKSDALEISYIVLGVIATFLAILQELLKMDPGSSGAILLKYILIIIPIVLTLLITISNRFKQGNKWLLLRSAAESIKREIFRYRTRAKDYMQDRQQVLAQRVEDITRRTMTTEVNTSSIGSYDKAKGFPPYLYSSPSGNDDGFGDLTPERYAEVRLSDQLGYFKGRTVKLAKQLKWLSWSIYLIGGIGTFLAATGAQLWIALTTVLATAITTYLGYRQTESTLKKYNQAATDLNNIRAWWNALSAESQSLRTNIDLLVEHTETVLKSELDGWVQQMQNALAELRKNQEEAPKTDK